MTTKVEPLHVMISWSGAKSKAIALTLTEWIECVVPGVEVWISADDIAVGKAWFSQLMDVLERAQVCIICVTDDNVSSPWIYYEAGAIAANGQRVIDDKPLICSYLASVDTKHILPSPLGQFQWAAATKEDTWRMVQEINRLLAHAAHNEDLLRTAFSAKWPPFKRRINGIMQDANASVVQA